MEQKYNLKELFVLNSMHDLRVQQVELKKGVFILHYKKICQNKNIMFDSCDVIFNEVYDADVFAEVRKCNGLNVEGKIYRIY